MSAKPEVEIFISTIDQPCFLRCQEALSKQTMKADVIVIRNISPMSEAFNEMIRQASGKYFIQVDEDMVLYPGAVEALYNGIEALPSDVICLCMDLYDQDTMRQIQGVKIYRSQEMKKFAFKNLIDCEMEIMKQWEDAGQKIVIENKIIGDHCPIYDLRSAFNRGRMFAKKELFGFSVMTENLKKKLGRWQAKPSDKTLLFNILGLISGYSVKSKYNERNRYDYEDVSYDRFFQYFTNQNGALFLNDVIVPEISVVMAVKDEEESILRQSIESILKQSYLDFEFIIVTNGSGEETFQIIESYAKQDKRIKHLNIKEANLVNALNYGVKNSKGRYVARQDDDDLSNSERLLIQRNYLENHPEITFCGTNANLITDNGEFIRVNKNPEQLSRIKKELAKNNCFTHGSIMIRGDVIRKHQYSPKPEHIHIEDFELWRRLVFKYDFKATNLQIPLYTYRVAENSVCRSYGVNTIQTKNRQRLINEPLEKRVEAVNKTLDFSDLEGCYSDYVKELQAIRQDCDKKNVVYNIDGLDNVPYSELSRYWEYSHALYSLDLKDSDVILEAGSGFSFLPIFLSHHCSRVYSLDQNYKDIRAYMAASLGRNVISDTGRFQALPYPDEFFDKVSCVSCIEHLQNYSDVEKSMSEFKRVLKPGGLLFVSVDYHKDFFDYGTAGWKWSSHTRFYNWKMIMERIIKPSGLQIVGNQEFCDNTDWGKPPLYGNYTFAAFLLRK